jgi:hypothetical protein
LDRFSQETLTGRSQEALTRSLLTPTKLNISTMLK